MSYPLSPIGMPHALTIRYLVSQSKQLVVDEPYLFQAAVL